MENIEIIKKRIAVFLLTHKNTSKHELIDKAVEYFNREIEGEIINREDWKNLVAELGGVLGLPPGLDPARVLALDLARDLARGLGLDRGLDLDRALDLDLDLDLANYLLPLVDEIVPNIPDLDKRILEDITLNGFYLEMASWHACETTHCRAGFCELYAGDQGEYLVKRFGNWMCGALIYLKSTGRIPDFYASNEDALEDIKKHAV